MIHAWNLRSVSSALFLFCFLCSIVSAQTSGPENEDKEDTAVAREVYGFKYDLPPDYPIEKVNGLVKPVAMSDYVYMKFTDLSKRIDELTRRLDKLEGIDPEAAVSPAPSLKRLFLSLEQSDDTQNQ